MAEGWRGDDGQKWKGRAVTRGGVVWLELVGG